MTAGSRIWKGLSAALSESEAPGAPNDTTIGASRTASIVAMANKVVLVILVLVVFKVVMVPDEDTTVDKEDKSIMQAILPILLWAGLGICLILFNKCLFMDVESGGLGFPCPMALTWCQMMTATLATTVIRFASPGLMPAIQDGVVNTESFMKTCLPIGVISAVYLAIGNTAYLYLNVHFIQMLKSAGPVAVHAVAVLVGMEQVSIASFTTICVVVFGVLGASIGEVSFNAFGFALQLIAMVLDGIKLVLFKVLMSARGLKLDPLSGLHCYAPVCVLTLVAPVAVFEGNALGEVFASASTGLYLLILLNCFVAFALNLALLALISTVGPTTLSVASVVRDIFLTFFSAAIFHKEITRVQVFSYFSAVLGIKLWDQIKARPHAFNAAFGLSSPKSS